MPSFSFLPHVVLKLALFFSLLFFGEGKKELEKEKTQDVLR